MTKKTNLAEALQKQSTGIMEIKETQSEKNTENRSSNYLPPSRQGKKTIIGYFDPDVIKQLKLIGIDEDLSIQSMMQEALNDFFVKHGKSQIA